MNTMHKILFYIVAAALLVSQWQIYLQRGEIKNLKLMIDHRLHWEDLKIDNH